MDIKQAISLIRQGQKQEAQVILKKLIQANAGDVAAWFWYAETLDSLDERIQLLKACLKENPGNPQVIEALEMLQSRQHADSEPPKAPSPHPAEYDEPEAFSAATDGDRSPAWGTTLYDPYEKMEEPTPDVASLPDIDIHPNKKILAYLGRESDYPMIAPYADILGPYPSPALSDPLDYFLIRARNLPGGAKYLVYHCPALVHPRTGILIAFLKGENRYYRLPEANIRELLRRKVIVEDDILVGVGDDWVSSLMVRDSFIDKSFAYYGNASSQNASFPLKPKQDIFLSKTDVVGSAINILYLVAFLIAIGLIGLGVAYLNGILP